MPKLATSDDYPGPWTVDADPHDMSAFQLALHARNDKILAWVHAENRRRRWRCYLIKVTVFMLVCLLAYYFGPWVAPVAFLLGTITGD